MLSELTKALIRMWSSSTPPHAAVSLGADQTIRSYAEMIIMGRYDPEAALASIDRFAERQEWPDLQTLLRSLPIPGPKRIAPPTTATATESWSDRCKRLFPTPELDAIRMSRIGVANWSGVMQRHRQMTDAEVVAEIERLDRYGPRAS